MAMDGEQEFTTDVEASVQQCFTTVIDFESYPTYFSNIEHAAVLEQHPDGTGKRVEFWIDMKLKRIRYVLEYAFDKPKLLTWKSVDGDIKAIEGAYTFEKLSASLTRVTCRQAVSIGFWVPGPIRKLLEREALKQSVIEFKAAAEKAAGAQAAKRRKKS